MAPEVLAAMQEAAGAFVDISLLYTRASERIARLLGVEAVCITSGASAGIAISAAACITKGDLLQAAQLPVTNGAPYEIMMLKSHRLPYEQALMLTSARIREVDTASSDPIGTIEEALQGNISMLFYVAAAQRIPGSIPLPEISRIMKAHDIPIVVDAAAELPRFPM
ncbi:aminotransferase class V-fold PLP-dependent enzyme [Paenibacillus sp. CC-CFT747]|nr:aminotransferase class V-fold PLP-dependent enzyme [Paenibacillus sp. CC-CFT747]